MRGFSPRFEKHPETVNVCEISLRRMFDRQRIIIFRGINPIMNIAHAVVKPYYLYRPSQILRRIDFALRPRQKHAATIILPWGLPLRCNIEEETGYSLVTAGIYDLALSEMIARMTRRGEVAIDVGANVGYVTSLMAVAVGTQGTVFSFEPHPRTFCDLQHNVLAWNDAHDIGTLRVFKLALSNSAGMAFLTEPEGFERNCGLASIAHDGEGGGIAMKGNTVNMVRLDEIVKTQSAVGIMKVDVEGHESRVFEGAGDLLSSRKIRDVVFEEFALYPAPTHRMLESFGYTIFHVEPRLLGPALQQTSEKWQPPAGSPPNYLATSDPGRALRMFEQKGWYCLAGRSSCTSPRTLNWRSWLWPR